MINRWIEMIDRQIEMIYGNRWYMDRYDKYIWVLSVDRQIDRDYIQTDRGDGQVDRLYIDGQR